MPVSFLDKVWDFGKSIWDSTDPNRQPPPSDLTKFIAQVKQNGLARNSQFVVAIDTPHCLMHPDRVEALGGDIRRYNEMMAMLCKSAVIPGISFDTSRLQTFGHFEVPYDKIYEPITLTFYMDSKMETKVFFDHWMDSIQLYSTKGFAFYKDFVTTLTIDVFNRGSNKVYSVQLNEAYPKSIDAITLDYGNNEIMLLTITFNYKAWVSTTLEVPKEKEPKTFLDELFGGNPIYEGAKSAIGVIGKIFNTVEEYTGRFEAIKGKGMGLEDQIKGLPGIFKSKVNRIKDLKKWL